jgi:hypothetical protein
MGIATALFIAALLAVPAFSSRPQLVAYGLLLLIVFFEELGTEFTSFNGSFVFNQDFLGFMKLKLIEVVVAVVYPIVFLVHRRRRLGFFGYEKVLLVLTILLIGFLLTMEQFLHRAVTLADWRLFVVSILLIHIFCILINDEKKLVRFAQVLVVMLSLRALVGLGMYFAGHGELSPRGMVPFFWDSRQVDAFAFGIILLTAYLSGMRSLAAEHRIFSRWLAIAMLIILSLTVLLSIRRSVWAVALAGAGLAILAASRARILHLAIVMVVAAFVLVAVLVLPGLKDFRERIGAHVASLDIASSSVAQQRANEVHIDNVQRYFTLIVENPRILLLGYRSYGSKDYRNVAASYASYESPLGQAHNGLLRSLYFFGIGGLAIYLLLYVGAFVQVGKVMRIPESSPVRYIATGSVIFLFVELLPALVFVPPFYTTIKGNVFTLVALWFLRAAAYYERPAKVGTTARRQTSGVRLRHG